MIMILSLLVFPTIIFAQNCEQCKLLSYPYVVCVPNSTVPTVVCSNDPYSNGKRPWKMCLPTQIEYDASMLDVEELADIVNGQRIVSFKRSSLPSIIVGSLNDWYSICTINPDPNNCQNCTIKVLWSNEELHFPYDPVDKIDYRNQAGFTSLRYNPSSPTGGGQCKADCENSRIWLNNTEYYTRPDDQVNSYPRRFFWTEIAPEPFPDYDALEFRAVILHEMGHFLGFGHTSAGCGENQGIMDVKYNHNSLSEYDKCMYRLLYCCPRPTDVQEEPPSINSTFNIFPNPISSGVTIALSPTTAQYSKHLRVIDMGGKIVMEQQFQAGSSDCTVSTAGFAAGNYLIIMTFDGINGSFAQKVIVQ